MRAERLDERVVRWEAPNGLRILTEQLPGVRSSALGIWFRRGGAHDRGRGLGAAHLLEHMVFKGTERRSAHEIARALEARGATLDAFTSRDHTNYQAHLLDTDLPVAVDVLTDLVRRPLLRESDLELERQVVLEEISGVQDTPDDLVFERHGQTLWGDHPYGQSILGSEETVSALSAAELREVHTGAYHPGNCVIACAGSVEADALIALLEAEGWLDVAGGAPTPVIEPGPARHGVRKHEVRDITQCHLVFGTDTVAVSDPRRYVFSLITTVLGGGMSSRLFQKVREELGLAYAIFAYHQFHRSAGQAGVYVGTRPETAALATEAILGEYRRIATEGLPAGELEEGKRQLKGHLVLGLESAVSRMHRLAAQELNQLGYRPLDQVLAEIDAVTPEQVAAVGAEFFAPERQTIFGLGPEPVHG